MPTDATHDLKRDGFTILKGVHPRERTQAAREFIQRVIVYAERQLGDPYAPYYLRHRADQGALYDVVQRHPELHAFAREPVVLDTLATELGEDIYMYENSVVYKPRGKRNAVPYHQDFISRADEPLKLIAWSAMEPVTAATGAMWVFPGSHKLGFLPWHRVKGETHHDRIVEQALPDTQPVQVEMEEGDVLVFNQMLVHGSDEVHAETPRIAIRVSYQGFGSIFVPRGTPLVVRGGSPEELARLFPAPYEPPRKPALWRRALRYVGRRLAAM